MARTKYKEGDMVYMVSDPEQLQRQIVEIIPMKYVLRIGTELVEVREVELADEENALTKILSSNRKED